MVSGSPEEGVPAVVIRGHPHAPAGGGTSGTLHKKHPFEHFLYSPTPFWDGFWQEPNSKTAIWHYLSLFRTHPFQSPDFIASFIPLASIGQRCDLRDVCAGQRAHIFTSCLAGPEAIAALHI